MAMVPATLSSTPPISLSTQPSMTSVDPTFHMFLDILKILSFNLTSHINTMIFKDSQVMIGDEVETLVHHGVPIFVVGFVHLHCLIKPLLFEVKDKDEAK